LAKTYGNFGSTVTAAVLVDPDDQAQNVLASRTYPDAAAAWARTVSPSFFVPAARVPSFLASAYFDIYHSIPGGGNVRVDWFSLYVSFTIAVAGELAIPINLTLDVSSPRLVIGSQISF
jgi:hypothetical protein